jgi:hypothetical protein
LHWNTVVPFQVQQQLQAPPASILQRFCNAPQATSSSHEQVSFMPPAHFSNFAVHRGKMQTFDGAAVVAGEFSTVPAGAHVRSSIMVDISHTPLQIDSALNSPKGDDARFDD